MLSKMRAVALLVASSSFLLIHLFIDGSQQQQEKTVEHNKDGANYEAPEPFSELNELDCLDCGQAQPLSPDPLQRAIWNISTLNATNLQIYRVLRPASVRVQPSDAVQGIQEWLDRGDPTILTVTNSCSITIDWGVERAAWFEILSDDDRFSNSSNIVEASISEFDTPYPGKRKSLTKYGLSTYRLETNAELYEGVRFSFLFFDIPTNETTPIRFSNPSLVAKIKPVSYRGAYETTDPILTSSYYTGAYAVRLNMESTQFNSILMERGDRVAIQGDSHPCMAAALVAFGGDTTYDLMQTMLWHLNSGSVHGHSVVDEQIRAYPLYWILSVLDWYWATGDTTGFMALLPDCLSILNNMVGDDMFLNVDGADIVWMGWDDRLGNGWCYHSSNDTCPPEAHYTLAGLVVRVVQDIARTLRELEGMESEAQLYETIYRNLVDTFRKKVTLKDLGVHSAANALNAHIWDGQDDQQQIVESKLNNPASLCSWSPFNQYWILQGLGNAGDMERALASVELCWGPMVRLGKGCFWELSEPDWVKFLKEGDKAPIMASLCHPWSSGVTAWLAHVHGGIVPLRPGYKEVVTAPYVSWNHPYVAATMPTPIGPVIINATLSRDEYGGIVVQIELQSSVPVLVGLRTDINDADVKSRISTSHEVEETVRLFSSGTTESTDEEQSVTLLTAKEVMSDRNYTLPTRLLRGFKFVELKKPGTYRVISTSPAAHFPSLQERANTNASSITKWSKKRATAAKAYLKSNPFPVPTYAANVTYDRELQGDGLYDLGRDGYLLLGYHRQNETMANDEELLPRFVKSIRIRHHGYFGSRNISRTHVGTSHDNPMYLPDPNDDSNCPCRRSLGMVGYQDVSLFYQMSILVDIEVWRKGRYELSLYSAGGLPGTKHAVRIMDLDTLDPIAPTVAVDNYHDKGVWMTVSYNASMRLRVMGIYGMFVSALAFTSICP